MTQPHVSVSANTKGKKLSHQDWIFFPLAQTNSPGIKISEMYDKTCVIKEVEKLLKYEIKTIVYYYRKLIMNCKIKIKFSSLCPMIYELISNALEKDITRGILKLIQK